MISGGEFTFILKLLLAEHCESLNKKLNLLNASVTEQCSKPVL